MSTTAWTALEGAAHPEGSPYLRRRAFERGDVVTGAEERGELAARGAADGGDAGGVDAVLGGMGAEPADGRF
jgi:hypothetical protein